MKKKIFIVDDYNIYREGLKLLLETKAKFEVIGEASTPQYLFLQLEEKKPDVIILNLLLPKDSVINICHKLYKEFPNIYFIIIAVSLTEHAVLECVINGARGILSKDSTSEQLIEAINVVASGERYLNIPEPEITKQVIQHAYIKHSEDHDFRDLSSREQEVLKLFAKGLSYKEIGENLNISPRTVESHKNNILAKLNLNSVNEMIKYAIKHNLINLE
ncbi:response regulator transcription factor [Prolixibacteraceae bacterium Z1-6]|uniref:Response regulator transcription factor n=1 Tax=Draconibacterium aestuarii TaxID=2998507 RepID=A0A9X3F883_9BACT|nr:response regulator transcription factor [Prolixibacteraceae bacterium Z1-6]